MIVQRVEPYVPVYCRPPNKFIRMEESEFDDGAGHIGVLSTAIFFDKSGKEKEMVARIKWSELKR